MARPRSLTHWHTSGSIAEKPPKDAPLSLAQDSALLTAIMDASVDAIIVSDARGTIRRANAAAHSLFGHDPGALIGLNVSVLMPKAMAEQHDVHMAHHIATGERRIIDIGRDVEGQRRDGTAFPVHLSVGRADVDGDIMFIAILHDLTQRRLASEALARSQRLDAVGQMTGGIAHDFNNLLTVIIGNLELLERRDLGDGARALLHDALETAELGADLTSRLLIFARKGNLNPEPADLREVCQSALALLRRTIGADYTIRTDFADTVSPVMVDRVQLQSALINLAMNARDAMPEGGEFLISVADTRIDDSYMAQETDIAPGDYVRIYVSDDGAGMSAEAQKRAFEPFFTTKQDRGGTGLGLAMVYGFVRQSGGHITLYSELGHGTSFGLYFPALKQGDDTPLPETERPEAALPLGDGEVVLVVEDNPRVRRLSVNRIRDLGYRTLEAGTGDEALAILTSGTHVDILFSDLVMPGTLDGFDLALRVEAEFPDVRILLTSGYASDVISAKMGTDGAHDVLHKPFRQSDLAALLYALRG